MRVLILGSYGMLGHKLMQRLESEFEIFGTCRQSHHDEPWISAIKTEHLIQGVHAEEFDTVSKVLIEVKPDVVINCIGVIKQSDTINDPIAGICINSLFPHLLDKECASRNARLIHFSSDCIFSGRKGMYLENDSSDAQDFYGKSKFLGEVNSPRCFTIRSSIIGRELSTKMGLLEWFLNQKGKSVKGYNNAIFSGFTTLEMSKIVSTVLKEHGNLAGIWHIASNPISKYDLLSLINQEMNLGIDLEPDDSIVCDRSLNGNAFSSKTGYKPPSWKDMIKEMVKDSYL